MDQVIQPISNEAKKAVEIVVHVTEELDEDQRSHLVSALENTSGITGAEFCPLHFHLMLVRYERDVFSSQDVLKNVALQNISARLIGPV
ncbi:MAG: hypothetical protein ABFS22_10770 [Pseudomonadota bacterium]